MANQKKPAIVLLALHTRNLVLIVLLVPSGESFSSMINMLFVSSLSVSNADIITVPIVPNAIGKEILTRLSSPIKPTSCCKFLNNFVRLNDK